ncbi:MAG: hypothetical protein EOP53_07320, partial [Sphingobacteriales bacterium]
QIILVKQSWNLVAQDPQAGMLFYGRLFEIAPQLRPMFRGEVAEQSQKLTTMLNYVIKKLDVLPEIIDEVKGLAKRHVKYGVQDEHYQTVGAALLWSLEKGLGEHWTEPVKDSWVACYTLLSNAMIQATKETEVLAA